MPKSKRSRVVALTKTKPRGSTRKSELIESVQTSCDKFKSIYLFSCENLRSDPLKRLRADTVDSRFLYGKNKVVRLALGKTAEEAYLPGLNKLGEKIKGDVGLVFTNSKPSEFEKKLQSFKELDFARSGYKAQVDIVQPKGPIVGQPSSMFEPLRKLLLPVKLNKGVIELEEEHYLCREGDVLTPEQAQALKFFDHKLAEFSVKLLYRFRGGQLSKIGEGDSAMDDASSDEEEEEEEDF